MRPNDRHHIDRARNPEAYDAAMKHVRETDEDEPDSEEERTRRAEQAMERAAGIR